MRYSNNSMRSKNKGTKIMLLLMLVSWFALTLPTAQAAKQDDAMIEGASTSLDHYIRHGLFLVFLKTLMPRLVATT